MEYGEWNPLPQPILRRDVDDELYATVTIELRWGDLDKIIRALAYDILTDGDGTTATIEQARTVIEKASLLRRMLQAQDAREAESRAALGKGL